MSKFLSAVNLLKKTVTRGVEPWEFQITVAVPAEVRNDKAARQAWYRQSSTNHNFYTGIEAANPNQRVTKTDNPPRYVRSIAADYDLPLSPERIAEAITAMAIKPSWVETSLGGKARLIWLLPRPILVENYDFCSFLLERCSEWLGMDLLPGLDNGALTDPARMLCNGGIWQATGHPAVTECQLQSFFVLCGQTFRFKGSDGLEIPMDVVERGIKEAFPDFTWPGDFLPESTGPSFWVPGSTSSQSAIVKPEGMFTFSDHADKPFYTWADILGAEFVKAFTRGAITKATDDVWWDEKKFWRKKKGIYTSMDSSELQNYFRVECNLSLKSAKGGVSPVEQALGHIYNESYVVNAAPYVFQSPGLLMYQGKRRLNTYVHQLVNPSEGEHAWGPDGSFPFISKLLDNLFTPAEQLPFFLAWWKHYYLSGLNLAPAPGQVIFLMGGVGVGKTLLNRELVGRSVGGYVDAANHVIKGAEFNFQMYEVPHWCIDDDTVSDSPQAQANVQAVLKKSVANHDFMCNKKFNNSGMTSWMGRIICTTNLDYMSSRMLGPLDNASLDKISVFRCTRLPGFAFPSRAETSRLASEELPNFLSWLTKWTPPDSVGRCTRFGYASWQEPTLLNQAHQTSKVAPFKELLIDWLQDHFAQFPTATEWRGGVTKILQGLYANPLNEQIIRTLRLEQVNRYLEFVEKEGVVKCRAETGEHNTRVWVFDRMGTVKSAPAPAPALPVNGSHNVFQKV